MPEQSKPTEAQSLAARYDIENDAVGVATEAGPSRADARAPAGADTPAPAPLPPRDPDTGRFLKPGTHSPRLVKMARDLGLTDDAISETTPEDLRFLVSEAQAERREATRAAAWQEMLAGRAPTPSAEPPGSPEPSDALGINEAEYDSGIVGVLKSLKAEIKSLKAELSQVQGHVRAQAQEATAVTIDKAFEKHKGVFGEGRGRDLKKGSAELFKRQMALHFLDAHPSEEPLQERIDKAVQVLFAQNAVEAAPKAPEAPRTSPDAEAWSRAGLAVPTQRSGSAEPDGVAKARKAVKAQINELNGAVQASEDSLDDFPG